MNIKKILLIILCNLMLILAVDFLLYVNEKTSFLAYYKRLTKNLEEPYDKQYERVKIYFRKPIINNEEKNNILLLGCSFAYGHALQQEQTFAYKLATLLNSNVYNKAFDFNWGFHNAYYLFTREDFFKEIPKMNTIIYLYIEDHKLRANGDYNNINNWKYEFLNYKLVDGELKQYSFWSKNNLLNTQIPKTVKKYLHKKNLNRQDKLIYYKLFFTKMKEIAQKNWGDDINFIILNYAENEDELIQELKKEGFLIINLFELTDEKIINNIFYTIQFNDDHPNEKAWDLITPLFIKKVEKAGIDL